MAIPTGAETPAAVKPEIAADSAPPEGENSEAELLPELASHTLPRPSMAMAVGVDRPPPENGEFAALAPEGISSVSVELPELADRKSVV